MQKFLTMDAWIVITRSHLNGYMDLDKMFDCVNWTRHTGTLARIWTQNLMYERWALTR